MAAHRWIGQDDYYVSCLTCGYLAEDTTPDDITANGIVNIHGDAPGPCTYNTSLVHGYPGERYCHDCNTSDCEHTNHDCDCMSCDS